MFEEFDETLNLDSVGTHSMALFQFKVSHTSENRTVQKGNRYLHLLEML